MFISYFNIINGSVAFTNDEWVWVTNCLDTRMTPNQVEELINNPGQVISGWTMAYDGDYDKVFISEEDFDKFLLQYGGNPWFERDGDPDNPAPWWVYVVLITGDEYDQMQESEIIEY